MKLQELVEEVIAAGYDPKNVTVVIDKNEIGEGAYQPDVFSFKTEDGLTVILTPSDMYVELPNELGEDPLND